MFSVSFAVAFQLQNPVSLIRFWQVRRNTAVLVPEAAVDEDNEAASFKNEVRSARKDAHLRLPAFYASPYQGHAEHNFGGFVSTAFDSGHPSRHRRSRIEEAACQSLTKNTFHFIKRILPVKVVAQNLLIGGYSSQYYAQ